MNKTFGGEGHGGTMPGNTSCYTTIRFAKRRNSAKYVVFVTYIGILVVTMLYKQNT